MSKDYPTFYSATSPCPVCGRYKSAYKNKCFGFITSNEAYAYCSREESDSKQIEVFGKSCWRHPLDTEGQLGIKRLYHQPQY